MNESFFKIESFHKISLKYFFKHPVFIFISHRIHDLVEAIYNSAEEYYSWILTKTLIKHGQPLWRFYDASVSLKASLPIYSSSTEMSG